MYYNALLPMVEISQYHKTVDVQTQREKTVIGNKAKRSNSNCNSNLNVHLSLKM